MAIPTNEKMRSLLTNLLTKTQSGQIKWSVGARADTFQWSGSAASVQLASQDNDGVPPLVVRLLDSEGRVVEDERFQRTNHSDFRLVGALYDAARRNARNVDATIDDLLGELGN